VLCGFISKTQSAERNISNLTYSTGSVTSEIIVRLLQLYGIASVIIITK